MEREAFERADAVVAVSKAMRADILRSYPSIDPERVQVVYNGIDIDEWKPTVDEDAVRALGIDPSRRSVVFVGRITRQKGLPYLLRAVASLPSDVQIVLCAGAPDTPEIMAEVTGLVDSLRSERDGVVWIDRMLSHGEIVNVLSSGTVFVCPSIYEPLGIVNLEAMACGIPVVGTGTGGIPEVVADGLTGASCRSTRRRTAPARRPIPTATSPTSRRRSTRSSRTRGSRSSWAAPDDSASRASSRGTPSPTGPAPCTTGYSRALTCWALTGWR